MFGFSPNRKIERYFRRHPEARLVVVAGSYGRRSAIQAIGNVLGQVLTVGVGVNHNEVMDVVILDFDASAKFPQVVPDFMVVTSCVSEADAQRFFGLANHARRVFINYNDVPQEYAKYLTNPNIMTYGDEMPANYYFENADFNIEGWKGCVMTPEGERVPVHVRLLGEHNLRPVTMAVGMGRLFGVPEEKIIEGAEALRPLMGHLKPGRGINGAIVIDDSADTSRTSVNLALRAIYALDAPSRILVLGELTPGVTIDKNLVSEVLVMDTAGAYADSGIMRFFRAEVDLLAYLATRMEAGGIVLLEYPLADMIESYIL